MRIVAVMLLCAACEKTTGVETSSAGSSAVSTATGTPLLVQPDASLATTPNDAVVAVADAAVAPVDAAAVARRDAGIGRSAADQARLQEEAAQIANVLAIQGSSSDAGDMSRRRPGSDLGKQIEEVRNGGRTVVIGGGTGTRGSGDPSGRPKIDTPGDVTPAGRVTVKDKQAFDDTSLPADGVMAKILSAYMAGIKRCYKTYLKTDPTARGKIALTFTVNEAGRTVSPKAVGFAKPLDDCLTSLMASWVFPKPKDRDGEPTDAAFAFNLALVPD